MPGWLSVSGPSAAAAAAVAVVTGAGDRTLVQGSGDGRQPSCEGAALATRRTGHVALACAVIYVQRRCANKVIPSEESADFITARPCRVTCRYPRARRAPSGGPGDTPDTRQSSRPQTAQTARRQLRHSGQSKHCRHSEHSDVTTLQTAPTAPGWLKQLKYRHRLGQFSRKYSDGLSESAGLLRWLGR